jgi:DNA-binding MarR family transcriptional regulator
MGIYDYMNHFWFENENDPCSLSEATLYFYLLYEANRQHWASPFKVSTQMLAARLNTSKQNVMKARDGLRKRGLIDFSKGEGKGKPALYTLCLSEEQSQSLSQLMTQQLTESLASELPQSLPHSNIKEENTTKEVGEEKQSPSSNSKVVLTLSELMEKLLNDNSWLLGLSERLAKNKIILNGEELKDKVREFFSEQEHKGCKGKEEADCREYVFNWIKYKYKNYYGNESKCNGQISTIKIEANRPEDYTGYC